MPFRVVVDYDVCESNAVCMGIAPDIFEVRDDDNLYILMDEVPDDRRAECQRAVDMCPKQALSLADA